MAIAPEDRGIFVANLLSLSRLPLAAALWVAPASAAWVLSIVTVAGITDVLDGWVIRRWRKRRAAAGEVGAHAALLGRGAVIDGFADKVFVASAVGAVLVAVQPPAWTVAVLLCREILFVPIGIAYRLAPESVREKVDFTAGIPGKVATVAQFIALVLGYLWVSLFEEAALVAGVLGLVAVIYYVGRPFFVSDRGPPSP